MMKLSLIIGFLWVLVHPASGGGRVEREVKYGEELVNETVRLQSL